MKESRKKPHIETFDVPKKKLDRRYSLPQDITISNEDFADAMGITGNDVIVQHLKSKKDSEGKLIITNYGLGFAIRIDTSICDLTEDQLDEIRELRMRKEGQQAKPKAAPKQVSEANPDNQEKSEEKEDLNEGSDEDQGAFGDSAVEGGVIEEDHEDDQKKQEKDGIDLDSIEFSEIE